MKQKVKADTLLRKIQKGSATLNTGSNEGVTNMMNKFNFSGESTKISLFRKREIVEPYLHPMDSLIVNEQIEKTVKASLKTVDPDINKNYSKYLPSHLVNDLYSLYYNPSNKMKFSSPNGTNEVKMGILDSINNSLLKIVTNGSHIGSYVYTEAIGQFLYKKFMEMPPEQRKKLEQDLNNCNQGGNGGGGQQQQPGGGGKPKPNPNQQPQQQPQGQAPGGGDPGDEEGEGYMPPEEDQDDQIDSPSQGNEKSQRNENNSHRGAANNSSGKKGSETDYSQEAADQMDKDLKNMVDNLNSKKSQQELDNFLKQAEQKLDKLRDIGVDVENDEETTDEEKKEIMRNLNNLDSIRSSLQKLSISKEKILRAVHHILSGATNYYSQKCIQTDVELFESDQLLDINGLELLHPVFMKSRFFDLSVTERKYIGKYDLYVDCSGSMSSGCGGDLQGVARIDLAKALAIQMRELGILGDLYEFEDAPKKILNTDMSILMMAARGGTDIEKVIKNILKTGNNSVVLSDGESHTNSYSHRAFFIGVGTQFHYFQTDGSGTGKKFIEEGQCVAYNGKSFEEVMPTGKR